MSAPNERRATGPFPPKPLPWDSSASIASSELSIAKARLSAVEMAIQRWTVIEALDDDGKPIGWGIAVDGYEDDGWLFYLPEKEQAALVVKAHNQEYDDAEEALYGDGHLAHLQWTGTT